MHVTSRTTTALLDRLLAPDADDVWSEFDDFFPAELKEQFEAFHACIDEQLGETGGLFFADDAEGYYGSVVVDLPVDEWASYDFGEGDGTVTVTYRSVAAIADAERIFIRLKISEVP